MPQFFIFSLLLILALVFGAAMLLVEMAAPGTAYAVQSTLDVSDLSFIGLLMVVLLGRVTA